MSMTFSDLQTEVKHRATRDQGGTQFNTSVKNVINSSLFRINREAPWRISRRKSYFDTVEEYTTGSGGATFTNDSKDFTLTGATLITDGIKIGRRINPQGSSKTYTIRTITSETTGTLDMVYDGDTISGTGTFTILPQEEYNIPIQCSHRMFLWHEAFGSPYKLGYITDQMFYEKGFYNTEQGIPLLYRMWGEDMVNQQPIESSIMTVQSSSSSDTNIAITVFGIVSGFPDYEIITTDSSDGTTSVNGSKSFSSIERVVKDSSSLGRITVTSNSANVTVSTLPVGDTTAGFSIRKIQLYPLPNSVFPINVWYYKDIDRLVNDGDVHELGKDFDESIILLSVSKIKASTSQEEADKFFGFYKDEIRSLRRTNMDKIDFFPKLNSNYASSFPKVHAYLDFRQAGANFGPSLNL